ncbi:MAG: hypothetical protein ACLR23_22175 [Clostridia bacterium]
MNSYIHFCSFLNSVELFYVEVSELPELHITAAGGVRPFRLPTFLKYEASGLPVDNLAAAKKAGSILAAIGAPDFCEALRREQSLVPAACCWAKATK